MGKILLRLKKYKSMTIITVIFLVIQTSVELLLPTLLALIINNGVVNQNVPYIIRTGSIMLGLAAAGGISTVVSSYYSAKIGLGFSRDLREDIFNKVEAFSLNEINKLGTASLITRTTNDVIQVQNFLIVALRMFIRAPIMALGGIFLAIAMDPSLSMILAVVVLLLVVIIVGITRRTGKLYRYLQKRMDALNLLLRERLIGIRVIRAFNREEDQLKKYNSNNEELKSTAIRINRIMAFMMPSMMLLMSFSTVAILWFGAFRIEEGQLMVGDLMAFIQYSMLILFSFIMLTMIFIMLPRAAVSADRIQEVLTMDFEILEDQEGIELSQIESLEFADVHFKYSPDAEPVLKDISFKLEKREKLGIIGGTGSGKSSLINLIPRFYDVSSGKILINGIELKQIKQKSLREKIGYVPQESFVISGTVEENIRFGKEMLSDEEINKFGEAAQLGDFVSKLSSGYKSEVYQSGKNLSGGQKQRLNIARAFAKKPDLYIFDDSFSALDYKTDMLVRKEIKKISSEAMVIMVAQRITTIMDSDQIIVLHEGKIAGIGTHEELLEKSEIYKEIVSSQLTKEEIS